MSRNPLIAKILSSPCGSKNEHLKEYDEDFKKLSKYGNVKTVVDEIKFDSKREAEFYGKLKLLLKAGEIGLIEMQVEYELNPGGTHSLKYIADFRYLDKQGITHVVDVKGFKTREYKKKKRLMKKVHGIIIEEA